MNDERLEEIPLRAQIAVAMGWKPFIPRASIGVDGQREPAKRGWLRPDGTFAANTIGGNPGTPDPFTNANDDVAILNWARAQLESGEWTLRQWHIFVGGLGLVHEYKVGRFARSLLYVLGSRDSQ